MVRQSLISRPQNPFLPLSTIVKSCPGHHTVQPVAEDSRDFLSISSDPTEAGSVISFELRFGRSHSAESWSCFPQDPRGQAVIGEEANGT